MEFRSYFIPEIENGEDYSMYASSFSKQDFEKFESAEKTRLMRDDDRQQGVAVDDADDDDYCQELGDDSPDASTDNDDIEIVPRLRGYTKSEILHMKGRCILEVPHNFVKKMVVTRNKIKKIIFGAFELRSKFPHNIALLKDGTIMYCTDFTAVNVMTSAAAVSSAADCGGNDDGAAAAVVADYYYHDQHAYGRDKTASMSAEILVTGHRFMRVYIHIYYTIYYMKRKFILFVQLNADMELI